jgi:hypothetical protein
MNKTVKKKVNVIISSQNDGLSLSCIALSFDGFGSISWHSIWFFGSYTVFTIVYGFPTFRPEYHWRDLSSRNAHLVHQNWYRISFTFRKEEMSKKNSVRIKESRLLFPMSIQCVESKLKGDGGRGAKPSNISIMKNMPMYMTLWYSPSLSQMMS